MNLTTEQIRELLTRMPDGATHMHNGNYCRIEGNNKDKARTFHECGGECYAYRGNDGCGENNKWGRYTDSAVIDETYISIEDLRAEPSESSLEILRDCDISPNTIIIDK